MRSVGGDERVCTDVGEKSYVFSNGQCNEKSTSKWELCGAFLSRRGEAPYRSSRLDVKTSELRESTEIFDQDMKSKFKSLTA